MDYDTSSQLRQFSTTAKLDCVLYMQKIEVFYYKGMVWCADHGKSSGYNTRPDARSMMGEFELDPYLVSNVVAVNIKAR